MFSLAKKEGPIFYKISTKNELKSGRMKRMYHRLHVFG